MAGFHQNYKILWWGSLPLESEQTVEIERENAAGDEDLEERLHPGADLQPAAGIGLCHEVIPTPADPGAAEEGEDKGADRQCFCSKRLSQFSKRL